MQKKINELLNPKQVDFMLNEDRRINLLTGSVRSGKTYVSLLKWAVFVASMPEDCEFLMSGKTLTSLKRNCLGLLQTLVGRRNFSFSISQKSGILFGRVIWLEGANDDRAESKIRGMTLAGSYVDELTQVPEDFYRMLLSRLSVKNAKLYATTNPDAPNHWVKLDIIDNDEIDKKVWAFTLDDNEILKKENEEYSNQLKKEYMSMGGVFYDRFILGLWVLAEGLIYRQFANHKEEFIRDEAVDEHGNKLNFLIISIGIDYGATKGETEFKANGITQYFREVWTIDEMKLSGLYAPEQIYEKFKELVEISKQMNYDVLCGHTVCNATRDRQEEASRIAQKVDAMIVIGDRHSSNTRKLYEICKRKCTSTYFIEKLDDLRSKPFQSFYHVGITAGASTPKKLIEEVHEYVRNES